MSHQHIDHTEIVSSLIPKTGEAGDQPGSLDL